MTLLSQNSGGGDYLTEDTILRPHPMYPSRKRRCCNLDRDGFTIITVCFSLFTLAVTLALIIQIHYGNPEVTPHGAVATDEEECSGVGIGIMQAGGSAVDVAIAAILCMSVVHPHTVGPGGSGVMLVHSHKSNTSTVVDFMTAVPWGHRPNAPQPGDTDGSTIGVPGLLRGLEYAHKQYGKLPWGMLFQPSIDIARRGFNVSAQLYKALRKSNITGVDGTKAFDRTFFPHGTMVQKGSLMRRENYAALLEVVANHGARSFYGYDFGVDEFNTLRDVGSEIRVKDLEDYEAHEHPCIHASVQNQSVFTAPAPFGGPQLLVALQLLQNSKLGPKTEPATLYHSFIEAIRSSYQDFIKLAYETNVDKLTEELLLARSAGQGIGPDVQEVDQDIPRFPDQAASSVSVIDTFDLYVSAVVGLGSYFGSRVMTSKYGILFNNHLANLQPHTPPTGGAPHPRPLTSYTPVIITDSRKVCGQRVVLASPEVGDAVQVAGQMLFRHHDLTQAIEEPRLVVKPGISSVFVEDLREGEPLGGSIRNRLNNMSYDLQLEHLPYTSVNGITKLADELSSWSDARGGGVAHRLVPAPRLSTNSTDL